MPELSTTRLFCRECNTEIFRVRRAARPPQLCEPCRPIVKRRMARESDARRRAGIPTPPRILTCQNCSVVFEQAGRRGQPPKRCPSCTDDLKRERSHIRNVLRDAAARQRYDREGRWVNCRRCGSPMKCARQTGGTPVWCRSCYAAYRREEKYVPAAIRPAYECLDCNVTLRPTYNNNGKKRCKPCGKRRQMMLAKAWIAANLDHVRERQRASGHRRRARIRGNGYEHFTSREIFERDRWICGICGRKINRRLRYPHPMAASLDHKIPVVKGGPHCRSNVQASHGRCNNAKRANVAPPGFQIPLPI